MTDPSSIYTDPDFKAWEHSVVTNMLPKLEGSAAAVMMAFGDTDAKFAVELGFSIMLDKPILALVRPGQTPPRKLALVADMIVEADMETEVGQAIVAAAVKDFLSNLLTEEEEAEPQPEGPDEAPGHIRDEDEHDGE